MWTVVEGGVLVLAAGAVEWHLHDVSRVGLGGGQVAIDPEVTPVNHRHLKRNINQGSRHPEENGPQRTKERGRRGHTGQPHPQQCHFLMQFTNLCYVANRHSEPQTVSSLVFCVVHGSMHVAVERTSTKDS